MLTDPTTLPEWEDLLARRFATFAKDTSLSWVDLAPKSRKLKAAATKTCSTLLGYLTDLHGYVDEALEIEPTLRARMMSMSSARFERVLHPIFEEDELTLILSGGGLGFLAGMVQQLVSTGSLVLPRVTFGGQSRMISTIGSLLGLYIVSIALKPRRNMILFIERLIERTQRLKRKTRNYWKRRRKLPDSTEQI